MAREPITKHANDHRPAGTYSATDPGGHDPIPGVVSVTDAAIPYATATGSVSSLAINTGIVGVFDTEIVMDTVGGSFPEPFSQDGTSKRIVVDQDGIYEVDLQVKLGHTGEFTGSFAAGVSLTDGASDTWVGAGGLLDGGMAKYEVVNSADIAAAGGSWEFRVVGKAVVRLDGDPSWAFLVQVGNFTSVVLSSVSVEYFVYRLGDIKTA